MATKTKAAKGAGDAPKKDGAKPKGAKSERPSGVGATGKPAGPATKGPRKTR